MVWIYVTSVSGDQPAFQLNRIVGRPGPACQAVSRASSTQTDPMALVSAG